MAFQSRTQRMLSLAKSSKTNYTQQLISVSMNEKDGSLFGTDENLTFHEILPEPKCPDEYTFDKWLPTFPIAEIQDNDLNINDQVSMINLSNENFEIPECVNSNNLKEDNTIEDKNDKFSIHKDEVNINLGYFDCNIELPSIDINAIQDFEYEDTNNIILEDNPAALPINNETPQKEKRKRNQNMWKREIKKKQKKFRRFLYYNKRNRKTQKEITKTLWSNL